ncbi:ATP citrate (Pro-S)-lyase, partial [Puccinia sorghi]
MVQKPPAFISTISDEHGAELLYAEMSITDVFKEEIGPAISHQHPSNVVDIVAAPLPIENANAEAHRNILSLLGHTAAAWPEDLVIIPLRHVAHLLQLTQIKPQITYLADHEPVSSRWESLPILFWSKTPAGLPVVKVSLALIVGWNFDPGPSTSGSLPSKTFLEVGLASLLSIFLAQLHT